MPEAEYLVEHTPAQGSKPPIPRRIGGETVIIYFCGEWSQFRKYLRAAIPEAAATRACWLFQWGWASKRCGRDSQSAGQRAAIQAAGRIADAACKKSPRSNVIYSRF